MKLTGLEIANIYIVKYNTDKLIFITWVLFIVIQMHRNL